MTETLVLSLVGGVVGVWLGAGGVQVLSAIAAWPALISWSAVVLAVVFAGAVGIPFGLYPAC